MGSFPQNSKDIDVEKNKGNVATWQLTLENRAGALTGIRILSIFYERISIFPMFQSMIVINNLLAVMDLAVC